MSGSSPYLDRNIAEKRRMMERILDVGLVASCLNCDHWNNPGCNLANNAIPPPKVIVFSCGKGWLQAIPF